MNVVIYQSLTILIFVMFYGIRSAHVSISGNVTDFLGSNKTKLKCSFDVQALVLNFFAKNKTGHVQTIISIAVGSNVTFPSGEYLKTRVDVTQLKLTSRNLSVTFNELRCEDDQEYACEVKYFDSQLLSNKSYYSSIYVRAPPLKPSSISLVKTPEDSIISSTKHMEYSNSPPSTTVTSTLTESESLKTTIQKDTIAFNYSAVSLPDYDNTSSTPSDEDFSNNTSYRITTYSTQQATKAQDIAAGDNITIVCTGNVGKPAAKHVFKKYLKGQIVPMQDTVTTTSISELSENCSYYRTSNLTFQVTAADNNVVIRCVVDSSMAGTDMFIETKPIEVYYEVSMPTITKYPNESYYVVDKATSINLTCKSDGNPKPNYRWYKGNNNDVISTSANWTITDINVTNSGVYTCNVSNTFNGNTHINTKHVQINIMNKAYTTLIALEHSSTLDDVPTTQSSSTCSSSCVEKKEGKSKENFDDILTTQSSSICSSSCVDKKDENSNGNLGLAPVIVGAVVVVIVVIIVIIACRRRKNKSPTFKDVSKSFDDSKPKPVPERRTGDYDYIALEDDAPTTKSSNNGLEVEDIKKHNAESWKKDEEEKKKNESNTPPQSAVYALVNEATKSKNKQKTEAIDSIGKQEEDTYAELQDGIYDKAGDRRHKKNEHDEHYDSSNNSSKQNSNGDNKLSKQTSQVGSYANQGFEKDENRKVATVPPTVRSSSGSQNDGQTNSNRTSQSTKGYENIMGTEQTGISEEDSSQQTAL